MKINIPLDSVKKQIREEFRIAPLVTPEMREAEDLWMQIWMGTPPWANDQDLVLYDALYFADTVGVFEV